MKKLVIYFSHTGENYLRDGIRNITKGNTEIVAEKIAAMTGAELFKVETVQEYPYNYHECCDVAEYELNKNIHPKLKKYLDNITEYDPIYIGYPIWWGTMPMAMFSLLSKLDFRGKTIKPFATSEGSGLGSSVADLTRICPNAIIKKGLAICGSDASMSDTLVKNWLDE